MRRTPGLKVEPVPLPGSTDCVKNWWRRRSWAYSLPSIEPLAIIRPQGVRALNFYTAYQGNIYGIAVPEGEHGADRLQDLRGKRIGVTSMASGGVIVARALVANAGMNPDVDVKIVVAGEGAQTAALIRSGPGGCAEPVRYAVCAGDGGGGESCGSWRDNQVAKFPSNGFVALEETLAARRGEAVALARGYAMGTVFTMANPEAAIRILYDVYPQTKPTGKDDATAVADDVKTIEARAKNWRLEAGGVTRWGENSVANYDAYIDFLVKWGVVKEKVPASQLVTNELIADINAFDAAEVAARARAWK